MNSWTFWHLSQWIGWSQCQEHTSVCIWHTYLFRTDIQYMHCRRLISNQCNTAWQLRWDRANVARPTHDLLPYVGRKLLPPDDRCWAISYVRLLLEDSMLKAHQHGLHVTHECECGQGIEDTYHFLHECTSYVDIHQALFDEMKNVWIQFQWRPTYTVGFAPYCSVFWISINHSTVSVIRLYWQPSSILKTLHAVCNMTTKLCQPSTSVAQLCMDLQCD